MSKPSGNHDANKCCIPDSPSSQKESTYLSLSSETQAKGLSSETLLSISSGTFYMGADDGPHPEDGEGPVREVFIDGFQLAPTTVTNAEFTKFVNATKYVTLAETEGSSFVFHLLVPKTSAPFESVFQAPWWKRINGACWRWPSGPDGVSAAELSDHPAVHIALPDAIAYCKWAGTQLPTEAQWEYAARGGLDRKAFPWGDYLEVDGLHRSNVWQGNFPNQNTAIDGYIGTAPARSYEPNGFGLYAMTGNVWEWTIDRFTTLHSPRPSKNPNGPLNGARFVAKGGSYLCHHSYCTRYRTSSRQALAPNSVAGNIGFRVCTSTAGIK